MLHTNVARYLDQPVEAQDSIVFNRSEVLRELSKFVQQFSTQEEAANELEISRVFLWRVLNGHKAPSTKILEKIGFVKEVRQAEFYFKHQAA